MKKILSFALCCIAFSNIKAQTLTVTNYTSYSIDFTCTGSAAAPAPPCNRWYFSAPVATVAAGASAVYNWPSMTPSSMPLPPGWPGTGEFTDISVGDTYTAGCSPLGAAAVGNWCSGLVNPNTYLSCQSGSIVTVTWTTLAGGSASVDVR
jgi:hypothetical protein